MNESILWSRALTLQEMFEIYKEYISRFEHIIFWGAGDDSKIILSHLSDILLPNNNERKVSFIDKNKSKNGGVEGTYGKYPCYEPGWLKSIASENIVIVIATSLYMDEVYEEIECMYKDLAPNHHPHVIRQFAQLVVSLNIVENTSVETRILPISEKENNNLISTIFDDGCKEIIFVRENGSVEYLNKELFSRLYPYNKIKLEVLATPKYKRRDNQVLIWEFISPKVINEFFGKNPKIVLSSQCNSMKQFREYFSNQFDLVTCDANLTKRDVEGADVRLYDNLFPYFGIHDRTYCIRNLYAELLMQTILVWMKDNDIKFYFIELDGEIEPSRMRPRDTFEIHTTGNLEHVFPDGRYVHKRRDIHSKDANIVFGQRLTIGSPEKYDHTIYFGGSCTVVGDYARDEETIESYLQGMLNQNGDVWRVINCGVGNMEEEYNRAVNMLYLLMDAQLKKGDIVVLMDFASYFIEDSCIFKENYIKLKDLFDMPQYKNLKCFVDSCRHFDKEGNQAVAEFLYRDMCDWIKENNRESVPASHMVEGRARIAGESFAGLESYLTGLSKEHVNGKRIGAIVMNCNPFTLGHFHLVEYASKMVEYLFVFVVEEDRSEFSFQERFSMARESCQGLHNVRVLPSGKYMISDLTFAEYFNKEELQDQTIIPTEDVQIFGESVAPCLGINYRFVGEEPIDNVTRQYNQVMKELLPRYGIEVVEIPRYQLDGDYVSASKIRKMISEGNMDECKKYLTDETWKILTHL